MHEESYVTDSTGGPPMSEEQDANEQRFLAAVKMLADAVEENYPAWSAALRSRPAVFVPHRLYWKQRDQPTSGVGCCEFPADHPIHNMPGWEETYVLNVALGWDHGGVALVEDP